MKSTGFSLSVSIKEIARPPRYQTRHGGVNTIAEGQQDRDNYNYIDFSDIAPTESFGTLIPH